MPTARAMKNAPAVTSPSPLLFFAAAGGAAYDDAGAWVE